MSETGCTSPHCVLCTAPAHWQASTEKVHVHVLQRRRFEARLHLQAIDRGGLRRGAGRHQAARTTRLGTQSTRHRQSPDSQPLLLTSLSRGCDWLAVARPHITVTPRARAPQLSTGVDASHVPRFYRPRLQAARHTIDSWHAMGHHMHSTGLFPSAYIVNVPLPASHSLRHRCVRSGTALVDCSLWPVHLPQPAHEMAKASAKAWELNSQQGEVIYRSLEGPQEQPYLPLVHPAHLFTSANIDYNVYHYDDPTDIHYRGRPFLTGGDRKSFWPTSTRR